MARLKKGETLVSTKNNEYTVEKFLDSGTQASVYLVNSGGVNYALKWYSKKNEALILHFTELMDIGVPKNDNGYPDERYVWPQELIVTDNGFGYTMNFIDMSNYIRLHRLTHHLYIKKENYIRGVPLCDICINIAEAFRSLHSTGYCYKDISSNNIAFNIKTGEVLIFDVDNVVISGKPGEIKGTPKYMAPEVILGITHPNSESDRFSLASYYFHMMVGHYPLEGKLRDEYAAANNNVFDDNGFKEVYGKNATFCFNTNDTRNNIDSADYAEIRDRWQYTIPPKLKEKFEKTFVKGLPDAKKSDRTTNREWAALFKEFKKNIVTCSCGKDYFPDAIRCTICKEALIKNAIKAFVMEKGATSQREVVFKSGSIIPGKSISQYLAGQPQLAEVLTNPKSGSIGLKNLSTLEWFYKDSGDASSQIVPPKSIIALKSGRSIAFIKREVQITVE